jgi:hypothetical protein
MRAPFHVLVAAAAAAATLQVLAEFRAEIAKAAK